MKRPTILFIDDVPSQVERFRILSEGKADVLISDFDEVAIEQLTTADLVLVDFSLDEWLAKDRSPEISLRPADGLAVVEILRSRLRATNALRPTAFAVLSNDLEKLTFPFPPDRREHMIASLAKLEWAFQKSNSGDGLSLQFIALAAAVSMLPGEWPHDSNTKKEETLHSLLGVQLGASWTESAMSDIAKCHPPIQELSSWSHGLAFLRWMLQRVLPYPTFLLDDTQAALRLGVTCESFCDAIASHSEFQQWAEPALYSGVLSGFQGRRWWKAIVDSQIWSITEQDPFNRKLILDHLQKRAPLLRSLEPMIPVACVDENYQVIGVAEAEACVRLRPDDWPLFADSAWAERTLVANSQRLLIAVEDPADRLDLIGDQA